MTNDQLQRLVMKISIDSFHRPFVHQASFNARLKTTGGRYHFADHHLDFNPQMVDEPNYQVLIGIIKHELCHYHLDIQGLPANHRSNEFKQLLRAVGGSRFAPALAQSEQLLYRYHCQQCGQAYARRRKINLKKYGCGKCQGELVLDGVINDRHE